MQHQRKEMKMIELIRVSMRVEVRVGQRAGAREGVKGSKSGMSGIFVMQWIHAGVTV
jgi:hypothetical protein